ncbi:uncharacterized protein MYCFIDRAFT_214189 [Pseudocercospora fijiensis CIRAD86]|uniref:Uncharacterized protein n=1 Tax=Pseudocercospora fijiensis (strain CIRAD86) TaxID=383855 RepID=M3A5A1_PSEFD|nr:uncharacterized protein MYCFIDRAFT_214189 [Pseudocercospora fijiensis CIRAD86]EME86294.1 hypothetical protein MYCFIDRAFT_214189 [Pseudocercospora fijiensis CIRAD86]
MDPTTLIAFLFRAPAHARAVELLGSWDNFERPYRMHHDRLRGSGFWSGCFKFDNIICDGHQVNGAKPRSGGLKQGGTYWYYYRLNYDVDAYDDRQTHTTHCPLLPGQEVNVIEVPTEVIELPSRSHSAHGHNDLAGSLTNLASLHTLNPTDKYAILEPPPRSKVHARCLSDDVLDGRLENDPATVIEEAASPVSLPQSREARSVSPPSHQSNYLHEDLHERRVLSGSSSVYSRLSCVSDAASQISAMSKMSIPGDMPRKPEDISMDGNSAYPCKAGPTPLASLESLGAALFDSTLATPSPAPLNDPVLPWTEDHQHQRRSSACTCGPESIANVQFYGSRPGTSLGEDPEQYRPRMYSVPYLELRDCSDDSSAGSPTSATFEMSERSSHDLEENSTSGDEIFDLMSPTLTATTLSTGGNNTPFRLSAQTSPDDIEHVYVEEGRHAFEASSKHPSRRPSQNSSNNSGPSFFERTIARLSPSSFISYSLPRSATESDNSLAKTISRPSGQMPSRQELSLPSMFAAEESSMADAIFSELGFLRDNIQ